MTKNKSIIPSLISLAIIIGVIVISFFSVSTPTDGYKYVNECDYKSLSFNTEIHTTTSNGETRVVEGNYIRFVTDPLEMKDANGNKIGYAGDTYHFISQDDHGIYLNGNHQYDVRGKFAFWGDKYEIYSHDGELIAKADFNMFDTKGSLISTNGTLIAEYHSSPIKNDYKIYVYNDEIIDEDSLIMIFASYVSDRKADNASGGSSSSSSSN